MSKDKGIDILFPPGRMVQGSVYKPNTTDADGKPLVVKSGPNAGQPRVDFFFAVAIPKTQAHWANEVHPDARIGDWGAKIWNHAHAQWPQGQAQRSDFAWKIEDGDSQIPNKKGMKNCDREGYPGHWVIKFGGGYAPKIVNKEGTAAILEPDAIKCGYYVQVFGNVSSNESSQTAGIYMNHKIVALNGFGEEISYGPDPTQVGFGAVAPGASAVPLGGMTPPVPGVPASAPPVPGVAPAAPVPTPAPNTGFVAGPASAPPPPGAAAVAPPPPAAPVRQMTAAATATYEAYIAGGWTDAQLIANGLMLP